MANRTTGTRLVKEISYDAAEGLPVVLTTGLIGGVQHLRVDCQILTLQQDWQSSHKNITISDPTLHMTIQYSTCTFRGGHKALKR